MSAEQTMADIVHSESHEDTKSNTVEELENVTPKDSKESAIEECKDQDDSIQIPLGYNRNIINAYILFKGMGIQDTATVTDLRITAYMIIAIQYIALSMLMVLVANQSDYDPAKIKWQLPVEKSWMIFPFFIIALLTFSQENIVSLTDYAMFNCDERLELDGWYKEFGSIKRLEGLLNIFGSYLFLIVIAWYGTHDWNGVLNSALNLLAYQFILQLDEGVLSILDAKLRIVLQKENKPELEEVFTGKLAVERNEDLVKWLMTPLSAWIAAISTLTMVPMWAYYSRSSMLIVIALSFLCCAMCCVGCYVGMREAWLEEDADADVDREDENTAKP